MDKLAKMGADSKFPFFFFIAIFLGIGALVFFVLRPFIYPFILAVVFSVLFYPLYEKLLGYFNQRKSLSAFIAVLLILLLILVPLTLLGIKIFTEANQVYANLSQNGFVWLKSVKEWSQGSVQKVFETFNLPGSADFFSYDLNSYLKEGIKWILGNLSTIFSSLSIFLFKIFIFLVMIYYLFKHGADIKKSVIKFSPLPNTEDRMIFDRLEKAIHSILRGSIIIAIIQGILAGLGFFIFGVPQPAFWGSFAAIGALIPGIGTGLVILPAVLFLFFSGHLLPAIGLLIWGMLVVGLIDNFLSPKLISRGSKIHPFLILLSILGGIIFFGPIGFLLGPLGLSLLLALFDIYYFRTAEATL